MDCPHSVCTLWLRGLFKSNLAIRLQRTNLELNLGHLAQGRVPCPLIHASQYYLLVKSGLTSLINE